MPVLAHMSNTKLHDAMLADLVAEVDAILACLEPDPCRDRVVHRIAAIAHKVAGEPDFLEPCMLAIRGFDALLPDGCMEPLLAVRMAGALGNSVVEDLLIGNPDMARACGYTDMTDKSAGHPYSSMVAACLAGMPDGDVAAFVEQFRREYAETLAESDGIHWQLSGTVLLAEFGDIVVLCAIKANLDALLASNQGSSAPRIHAVPPASICDLDQAFACPVLGSYMHEYMADRFRAEFRADRGAQPGRTANTGQEPPHDRGASMRVPATSNWWAALGGGTMH